jgi:hypothetical protein
MHSLPGWNLDSAKILMLQIWQCSIQNERFMKVQSSFLDDFYRRPWKGLFLVSLFFGKYKVETSTWKEGSLVYEGLSGFVRPSTWKTRKKFPSTRPFDTGYFKRNCLSYMSAVFFRRNLQEKTRVFSSVIIISVRIVQHLHLKIVPLLFHFNLSH